MPTTSPSITLGDPVVVAQGPADIRHWGPWQFPYIERLADGGLHVIYHLEADAYQAYGCLKATLSPMMTAAHGRRSLMSRRQAACCSRTATVYAP